eukprot:gene42519-48137_t
MGAHRGAVRRAAARSTPPPSRAMGLCNSAPELAND